MPLDVICRSCGGRFHETNDADGWVPSFDGLGEIPNPQIRAYQPNTIACASMFKLKEPYRSQGWEDFPKDPSYTGEAIECPQCGSPYPDANGRVKTEAQKKTRKK